MIKFFKKLHTYLFYGLILLIFGLFYPFLYYYSRQADRYYKQLTFIRKHMVLSAMALVGIRVKVTFTQPIDWSKNYVFCPNHTSTVDIGVLTYLSKLPISFIGKVELLNNPVTRIFFKTIDIPVKRESKISAFKAYKQGLTHLQSGKSLVIFPEGKIDDQYPPRLHPFKSGAFRMATASNTAIIPVVIHNAWQLFWDDGLKNGSKPGTIHVTVLAPIEANQLDSNNPEDLETTVYNRMKNCGEMYIKS